MRTVAGAASRFSFRPTFECLEEREVLAGPKAWLVIYNWRGQGLVPMKVSGEQGQWEQNDYTDPGTRTSIGKWVLGGEGDPVAIVAGSKPGLRACFSMERPLKVKTLQVKAVAADGTLRFVSDVVKVTSTSVWVNLAGKLSVGNNIADKDITLQWQERINGGAWRTVPPGGSQTSQQLFVTHAMPLNPATARRIDYAAHLADGISHTSILEIADHIDSDVMTTERFVYKNEAVLQNDAAWKVLNDGGYCADQAWLMKNALGVLGISAEVRYVMPRTFTWNGLVQTLSEQGTLSFQVKPGTTDVKLCYVNSLDRSTYANYYEGVCFVQSGATKRYYLGGEQPTFGATAYEVWNFATMNGALQTWEDDFNAWRLDVNALFKPVSGPGGEHPDD